MACAPCRPRSSSTSMVCCDSSASARWWLAAPRLPGVKRGLPNRCADSWPPVELSQHMPAHSDAGFVPLALQDRAYEFLSSRQTAAEDTLLGHVYGGQVPPALRTSFAEPLLADPR